MMLERLVIVPEGTTWDNVHDLPRGSLRTLAEADVIVTTTGHVLKDLYNDLCVSVIERPSSRRGWHSTSQSSGSMED